MNQKVWNIFKLYRTLFCMVGFLQSAEKPFSFEASLQEAIYYTDLTRVEALFAIARRGHHSTWGALTYACDICGLSRRSEDYENNGAVRVPSVSKEIALIKAILRNGACVNEQFWDSPSKVCVSTPLYRLVVKRDKNQRLLSITRLLLEAGADVNHYSDDKEHTLLSKAIYRDNFSMVKLLLRYNPSSRTMFFALRDCMQRIAHNDHSLDLALVALGKKMLMHAIAIGLSEYDLNKLLSSACYCNQPEFVELLLKAGADYTMQCDYDDLFLNACRRNRADILQLLVNAGAIIDCKDEFGNGPLHIAVHGDYGTQGNKEALEFLLDDHQKREELSLLVGLFE